MRGHQDVLSRIQWDPAFSEDEWVVGYEDRFTGIQELSVEDWLAYDVGQGLGGIPEHRIRYFRRNGAIVWDRRTKLDLLFTSHQQHQHQHQHQHRNRRRDAPHAA